ncbi:MAG TPA: chemotaxis protein, partial [Alphaproteobacteria bacterium]|nr:chemotaxis protein [Alphaproteobacteria bacterium]
MNFRAFSIRAKVLSIVVIAAVGLGAVGGVALNYLYDAMLASRALKTQHIVQVGTTLLGFYAGEAKAGRMTETEAQHAAMLAVKALRYGDNEYLWIND